MITRVFHYQTVDGRDLFQEWLDNLRDHRARLTIQRRVVRLLLGNLGDHKFCRDGVWELKINIGPGFRVYYALYQDSIMILFCAGTKRTQDEDISRAITYKEDVERRLDKNDYNSLPPYH
ncbi:MAG: type II toxin-antitoxin system RelE/ParE family toxin [Deltaproteobacteria bacterium]|nr:type II toxin-antitoxin system RelE/ParE family toxin [Deltaproteobacteria bacterium]